MEDESDTRSCSPNSELNIPVKKAKVNFTSYETDLLLELVKKRSIVLESRKTDFGTTTKKQTEWELLTTEFNSDPATASRTMKQLRTRWENVKLRSKKEIGAYKREVRRTGGGKGPSTVSNISEKVAAIIPSQMDGLTNPFAGDAIEGVNVEEEPKTTSHIITVSSNNITGSEYKEPARKKVKLDPRSYLCDWEYEEHKLRMKTLAVSHEIEVQKLEKLKMEAKASEEEHDLKRQLLQVQIAQASGSTFLLQHHHE